jgi:hypothetical protein
VQAAFFSRSPFFFYLHKDFLQNKRAERNYNLLRDRFWIHHEAWILLLEPSLVQAAQLKTNLTQRECSYVACQKRAQSPHPWSHANTTFSGQLHIRWCCIDLSNAPR